jgi:site-specific DNA recombinase
VSCYELSRFLEWDGIGLFRKAPLGSVPHEDRVHVVASQADAVCGKRTYTLSIEACPIGVGDPKQWLIDVVRRGAELRAFVLANRDRSISQLAKAKHLGPSQLSRYIRVNYLAPDIQAAIMDGTQPEGLTAWSLLNGPLPLDWEQQRQLLGFR